VALDRCYTPQNFLTPLGVGSAYAGIRSKRPRLQICHQARSGVHVFITNRQSGGILKNEERIHHEVEKKK
jgi:hypothetical protein